MNRASRLAATLIAVLLLMGAAVVVPLPYYLEEPGDALGLGDRLKIGAPTATPVDGAFLFTTVTLQPGTLAQLVAAWLDPETTVIDADQVIPPGQSEAAYFAHQQLVFEQTARRAAAVGLREAGFEIGPERFGGEGALVAGVVSGSAADGALLPGDVILAVDGRGIRTDGELREAIVGRRLRLTVRRAGRLIQVEVQPAPISGQSDRPVLGIDVATFKERIDLPVPFEVDSQGIGGPSAGLMIALAVYDIVDPIDLAGGRRIAGTGTIDLDGTIGEISGIEQKVRAAQRRGADVFLAPAEQLTDAQRGLLAGSRLQVIGVTTFDEALVALRPQAAGP
jgi:PDZ domain-containing protein